MLTVEEVITFSPLTTLLRIVGKTMEESKSMGEARYARHTAVRELFRLVPNNANFVLLQFTRASIEPS